MADKLNVRQHFDALDALRGVAALAVLILHVGEPWIAPHGYLAVDFFFILSGFVLAFAYENELASRRIGLLSFMRSRIIRLYPMIIIGVLLGALGFANVYRAKEMTINILTGLLLIPSPFSPVSEGLNAIPLNPPSWSLLAELLGNLTYAALILLLGWRSLVVIIFFSAITLICVGYGHNGLDIGSKYYNVYLAAPRFCFSFLIGVLLFRIRARYASAIPTGSLLALSILLIAIFVTPTTSALNWLFDMTIVGAVFPCAVMIGANTEVVSARACRIAGELSYPAYVLQGGLVPHMKAATGHLGLSGAASLVCVAVMVALYLSFSLCVLKFVDEPIRKRLLGRGARTQEIPARTAS